MGLHIEGVRVALLAFASSWPKPSQTCPLVRKHSLCRIRPEFGRLGPESGRKHPDVSDSSQPESPRAGRSLREHGARPTKERTRCKCAERVVRCARERAREARVGPTRYRADVLRTCVLVLQLRSVTVEMVRRIWHQ